MRLREYLFLLGKSMPDFEKLDESTWILYAAKNYFNPQCYDILEFEEDLNRFKYIKRLFNKYRESKELRERLILNHIISLNNVFGGEKTAKMLFFRLEGYEDLLAPFLKLLGILPKRIYGIGFNEKTVYTEDIEIDQHIEKILGDI